MWSLNGAPESQISGSESYCRAGGHRGVGVEGAESGPLCAEHPVPQLVPEPEGFILHGSRVSRLLPQPSLGPGEMSPPCRTEPLGLRN